MHRLHAQGICVILFAILLINLNSVSGPQVSWHNNIHEKICWCRGLLGRVITQVQITHRNSGL